MMGWLTKTTTLSDLENTWVYNLETIQVEDSVTIQKDLVHPFMVSCHSEILKLMESKYPILKRALESHQFYVYSTQDYDRGEIKIVDSERKIVTVNIYFFLDTIVLNCFSDLESTIPTMRRVDELSFSGFHNICNYLKLIFDNVEDIYSKDYKTKCIIALEELRSYFSGTIDLDLHFIRNVSGIQELLLCGDKNCYFYLRVKFLYAGDTQLSYSLDPEYHKLKGDEEDYTKDIISDCKSLNIDQWYRLLMQKITWITTKV